MVTLSHQGRGGYRDVARMRRSAIREWLSPMYGFPAFGCAMGRIPECREAQDARERPAGGLLFLVFFYTILSELFGTTDTNG